MDTPFHLNLASLFHAGNFLEAAKTIETGILEAGRMAAEAAMPKPVADVVDVPLRAVEAAIEDGTQKIAEGQNVGAVARGELLGIEDRLAQAVTENLAKLLPGIVAAAVLPLVKAAAGKLETATANIGR
jgi:hypothetical protein